MTTYADVCWRMLTLRTTITWISSSFLASTGTQFTCFTRARTNTEAAVVKSMKSCVTKVWSKRVSIFRVGLPHFFLTAAIFFFSSCGTNVLSIQVSTWRVGLPQFFFPTVNTELECCSFERGGLYQGAGVCWRMLTCADVCCCSFERGGLSKEKNVATQIDPFNWYTLYVYIYACTSTLYVYI